MNSLRRDLVLYKYMFIITIIKVDDEHRTGESTSVTDFTFQICLCRKWLFMRLCKALTI